MSENNIQEISKDPNIIANKVRQLRTQSKSKETILIFEGDIDQRFYNRFIDKESCLSFAPNGKGDAIHIFEILESYDLSGVLFIVDADFDRLEGKYLDKSNIFLTDTHDLETMILKSPALETLLAEYGSKQKIENITKSRNKGIRQMLLEAGIQIGYLRWVNEKDNLSLKFEGISFNEFIDENLLTLNLVKMIITVQNKSQRRDIKTELLQERLSQLSNPDHDPWDVCCGHDLVCILSLGLRKALGSNNANAVSPERIELDLRLSFELAYFLVTQLYKSLKAWEKTNHPFRIFKLSFNQ
jgi:hypothetical protein